MTTSPAPDDRAEAPLFADGIGERVVVADGATGELLQILRLRPGLTAVPSFEFALRERTARLANFRHAYYARVRRIDRVPGPGGGLAIVSDHVEGTRLSDLLRLTYDRSLQLDVNTALCLIRQVVAGVALLHENAREVSHGLIAPERLLVTPHARVVVVEHVLAAAIEQLQFGRDRLWHEFRVALPPSAGLPRFDHRGDVTGMGLVALALLLGRPLEDGEFPHRLSDLLNEARERSALGDQQPLSPPLRLWLSRALQIDPRRAFASGPEALAGLEEVVADQSMYVSTPIALETFLSRFAAALLEPPPPEKRKPAFVPPPPVEPTVEPPRIQPAVAPVAVAPATREPAAPPTVAPPVGERVPTVPDFSDFRLELERDEEMAKSSPVRHVTQQHPTPPKRETPPHVMREVPAKPAGRPSAPAARDTRREEPSEPSSPFESEFAQFIEAPDEALAEPWEVPARTVAPPSPAVTAEETIPVGAKPDVETGPAFQAVTARDIDELISISDLTPDPLPPPDPPAPDAAPDLAPELAPEEPRRGGTSPWFRTAALLLLIVAVGGAGVFASRYYTTRAIPGAPDMGTLIVQSRPAGVQIFVDGVDRGMTPARLSVTPGAHILELRGRGVPRVMPVNVAAGTQISQYIEFAESPATGELSVQSQPAGARAIVDGVDRGVTPLTVADLTPGDHEVILQADSGTSRHVVTVQAGATASLTAPLAASAPTSGWLAVKAPFTIEVREAGQTIGTTDTERLALSPGRHELELVNEALGYRATRTVQVPAGKVATVSIELPKGVVNLNAIPWAEVWIDGTRVGETPIGNLAVPIGPHEIVFRHPQFGEKRHAVSVTLNAPVRVSVDMK